MQNEMRKKYDFSKAKKNPYTSRLKKQITIRVDDIVIDYFKNMATKKGISYQNLINLYLADCVDNSKELKIGWR